MKYLFLTIISLLLFSGCTSIEVANKKDKSKYVIGMPDMFSYPVNEYTTEGNCVKFKDTINMTNTTITYCGTYFIRENLGYIKTN